MIDEIQDKIYGITVACLLPDGTIAFGQVKNTLSGTSLSGNWVFSVDQFDAITSVCHSHVVIADEETRRALEAISGLNFLFGEFGEFVNCVMESEKRFKDEWEEYLVKNPKKTKTLVTPVWPHWHDDLSIDNPIQSLSNSGKSAHPDSTPEDMKALIALARIVRHALDNWRSLEDMRVARKYLDLSVGEQKFWPSDWKISEGGTK
jgi:hypothetical protein